MYLGADNLGYHDGSDWNAYLDNSGNFYLGGAVGGSLSFLQSSGNLNVSGIISASAGIFGGLVIDNSGIFFPSTYDVGNQYFGESVVTQSLSYSDFTSVLQMKVEALKQLLKEIHRYQILVIMHSNK